MLVEVGADAKLARAAKVVGRSTDAKHWGAAMLEACSGLVAALLEIVAKPRAAVTIACFIYL